MSAIIILFIILVVIDSLREFRASRKREKERKECSKTNKGFGKVEDVAPLCGASAQHPLPFEPEESEALHPDESEAPLIGFNESEV